MPEEWGSLCHLLRESARGLGCTRGTMSGLVWGPWSGDVQTSMRLWAHGGLHGHGVVAGMSVQVGRHVHGRTAERTSWRGAPARTMQAPPKRRHSGAGSSNVGRRTGQHGIGASGSGNAVERS